jgi:surface antigen
MLKTRIIAATLLAAQLAACESPPSKEEIGTATGAVLGGVVGHQFGKGTGQAVATVGGAALGAFVGSRVGRKMDHKDRAQTTQALEASPDGEITTWRNEDSGNRYSVTPLRTYDAQSAARCREFTTNAQIEGTDEVVHGTACRQPDGSWKTL